LVLLGFLSLQGVVDQHILASQFQQHGIVEEFVDGHILGETLPAARLDHKLSRQVGCLLRLQGPDNDALVQRIARHYLPVMEHRKTKGLTLGVRAEIRLESK